MLTLPPTSPAKLSDFGFAQQMRQEGDGATAREGDGATVRPSSCDSGADSGRVCGTANYIAPELLSPGGGGSAAASDVWSLGCLMFALLFGQPPFVGSDTADTFRRVARGT
jgi:serine/threonine protein kinase